MKKRVAPSRSIGRKRLVALADYIEKKSKDRAWRRYFNMQHWFSDFESAVENLRPGQEVPINGGCGTAACMLGHAPNVPLLRKAGLKVKLVHQYGSSEPDFFLKNKRIMDNIDGLYRGFFGVGLTCCDVWGGLCNSLEGVFSNTTGHYDGGAARVFALENVTPMQAVRVLRKVIKQIDAAPNGWLF